METTDMSIITETVILRYDRSTKGAIKFQEVDANGQFRHMYDPETIIGPLYLRKRALGDVTPREIKVVISYDDSGENI